MPGARSILGGFTGWAGIPGIPTPRVLKSSDGH